MSFLLENLKEIGVVETIEDLFTVHTKETTGVPGRDAWYISEAKKNPLEASVGYLSAAVNLDLEIDNFLSNIKVPTLLLTGTEFSSLITVEEAEHFRDLIPRAKLVVIPGVQFIAVVAAPEKCAEEVLRFIKEQTMDS